MRSGWWTRRSAPSLTVQSVTPVAAVATAATRPAALNVPDGSIRLPDPWHNVRGVFTVNDEEIRLDPGNPYQAELENVGAAIRGEAEPRLGRADALGQARAIAALYASAETGAEVRLDGGAA